MTKKIRKIEITPPVAGLLLIGELYVLCSTLTIENGITAAVCGICGIGAACAAGKLGEKGWTVYAVVFGLLTAFALVMLPTFTDGCAGLLNRVIETFKQLHPRNYPIFSVETEGEKAAEAMEAVMDILAFLGGMSAFEGVRKPHSPHLVLHVGIGLLLLLVFGGQMKPMASVTVVLCAGMLYLLWISDGAAQTTDTVKKAVIGTWLRWGVLLCLIVAASGMLPFFSDSDLPAYLSERCSEVSDNLRYGNNLDSGLTGGKLSTAGKQQRTKESVLKVTMENPKSCYLRGFVGETYQNNYWKALDKESLYQNSDMFYWLHKDGFFAQNQIVHAARASGMKTEGEKAEIENLGACRKYLYLPYETADNRCFDAAEIGDSYAQAKGPEGIRTYHFRATENLIVQYQKIGSRLQKLKNENKAAEKEPSAEARTYLDDEAGYNAFVYQNYTQIPMEIEQYLAEKLGDYVIENGQQHFDYQAAKQNILYYLGKSVKYSEETDSVTGDIDFVLNFLDGSKKGYDVHYASAAVMLFRYYGIPARYAEGFLITKEDAKQMKPGQPYYIDGTHAHAWAEYYQDGVGWLPFETTPAYLSVMEKAENYKDISGLLGQKVGSRRADQQEQQTDTKPEEPKLKMFWIKHKVTILLAASLITLAILLCLFVSWLIHERKKTALRKAAFNAGNTAEGIRNIHAYMMDVLLAYGLEPQNCNPIEYAGFVEEKLQDKKIADGYRSVHRLWEEAKFSTHEMPEADRQQALQVNEDLWEKIWTQANFLTRMKLKYVYFL